MVVSYSDEARDVCIEYMLCMALGALSMQHT